MGNERLKKARINSVIEKFTALNEEEKVEFTEFVKNFMNCNGDENCEVNTVRDVTKKYGVSKIGLPEEFIFRDTHK